MASRAEAATGSTTLEAIGSASNAVIKEEEAASVALVDLKIGILTNNIYKSILSYLERFIYYENILHNYSSGTRLCCKSF